MLKLIWNFVITQTLRKWRLGALGRRSIIFNPMMIKSPARIFIGERCRIRDFARIEVIDRPEMGWRATLTIGNFVNIEQGVHIICQCDVTIEDDVSITPYVAIVDTDHPYDPPDVGGKIGGRLPSRRSFVHIGKGSFIGTKSVILPNVRIGQGCVIGAGSIVSNDIPDYSVAVGAPARVVSTFDPATRLWKRATPPPRSSAATMDEG